MNSTPRTLSGSSRRVARAGAALGALLAVLAVAGCGPSKAGAAVIIEGDRVPVSVIQDKVKAVSAQRAAHGLEPMATDFLAREQIQRLITHQVVVRAAAERSVTVSEGEIDKKLTEFEGQFGGAAAFADQVAAENIAPGDLRIFVSDFMTIEALVGSFAPGATSQAELGPAQQQAEDLLIRIGDELKVRINPRYGIWDAKNGVIAPDRELSEPDLSDLVSPGPQGPAIPPQPAPGQ